MDFIADLTDGELDERIAFLERRPRLNNQATKYLDRLYAERDVRNLADAS